MEEWLLARCSENLYFAHALEFTLRATCLPPLGSGVSPGASAEGAGGSPTSSEAGARAQEARGARESSRRAGDRRVSIRSQGSGGPGGGTKAKGNGEDEEGVVINRVGRRAVELLLLEIAQRGEDAAQELLMRGAGATTTAEDAHGMGEDREIEEDEENAPPPPGAVYSAGVSLEERKSADDDPAASGLTAPLNLTPYHETPNFVSSLTNIAASLTPLSKAERTPTLRKKLDEVGQRCLGSGAGSGGRGGRLVYVPLGNRRHRVVAVHTAESFAFSTRERAPCFVCLEVISSETDEEDLGEHGRRFEDRVSAEEGGARTGALWQWLPARLRSPQRALSFRRSFRFPSGRDWAFWTGEGDDHDGSEAVNVAQGAGRSVGGGSTPLQGSRGRGRRRYGEDSPGGGPGAGHEDSYRLMSEDGVQSEGEGSRVPRGDAMEWWAEGGGSAWGEEVDHGSGASGSAEGVDMPRGGRGASGKVPGPGGELLLPLSSSSLASQRQGMAAAGGGMSREGKARDETATVDGVPAGSQGKSEVSSEV